MKKGLKVFLIVIPIMVIIAMVASVIYSICFPEIIIMKKKKSRENDYSSVHIEKGKKYTINNVASIIIKEINNEGIKATVQYIYSRDIDYVYEFNKEYGVVEQDYSDNSINYPTPIVTETRFSFEKVRFSIYKPVVIAGGIIILVCAFILIKTKKPKGEKENGRND